MIGRRNPVRRKAKRVSLLLYMAGDNDLSDAGIRDVAELCEEGADDEVYVGVEIDTRGEYTGSIRYEITELEEDGKAYRKVIDRLPELDTGKPDSLLKFLNWGTKRYPADRFVVVIGGHGDGFRTTRRAIAVDEFGGALDMPEVEYVFERVGFDRKKMGILGFDACLMGMLEIANHFSRFAEYLVTSQQVEPGDGWPYDKVLRLLKKHEQPEHVATGIVDSYINFYVNHGKTNVTHSAVKLARTGAAISALSSVGNALLKHLDSLSASKRRDTMRRIDRIRASTQAFADAEYIDAKHFATLLSSSVDVNSVKIACRKFIAALDKAIIKNRVPKRARNLANANGLSIWFPATLFSFTVHRSKYNVLFGIKENPGWLEFLDEFFATIRYS